MGFREILEGINHFSTARKVPVHLGHRIIENALELKTSVSGISRCHRRIHHILRLLRENNRDAEISNPCVDHLF